MKNNIKKLLDIKRISINELSRLIEKDYPTTHALVNRDDLGTTQLDTLIKVANVLDVDIKTLYTDNSEELELIDLFDKNYAGGLSVLALRDYRDKIEQELEEKLNRHVVLRYRYNSTIDMQGVEDSIELDFTIGDRRGEDDRYHFKLIGKSVQLYMRDRLIDVIVSCINEYETGKYEDIEGLYKHLQDENMYPCLMELEKIEVEVN